MSVLGAVRICPRSSGSCCTGSVRAGHRDRLTLLDTTKLPMSGGGWVLLASAEEEIGVGWWGSSAAGD